MTFIANFPKCLVPLVLAAAALPSGAHAKVIVVQLKDSGTEGMMVFEPGFVKAMPGDTIRFVPANATHNAEAIPGMLPAGVTVARGPFGKPFDLVVKTPGVYGIKCLPHYAMGMVALVQVGAGPSPNLAAAKAVKLPPLAARRMNAYLASAR